MPCGKHRTSTKQAKEDVGGFSYRVGSVSIALNKRKGASVASFGGGENFFCMSMLIESIVCADAVVSLVSPEEVR